MDQATIVALLKFVSGLDPDFVLKVAALLLVTPIGAVILVLALWFVNEKRRAKMLEAYREDMRGIMDSNKESMRSVLDSYGQDVKRVAGFYEDNVELVRSYEKIADSLLDIVAMNASTMKALSEDIRTRQYCPLERSKGTGA